MTTNPDDLGLVGYALAGARTLAARFPAIVFTSGRRCAADQARAMAQNVAKPNQRRWIERTYRPSQVRTNLQLWLNTHPDAKNVGEIATGLMTVFDATSEAELMAFSSHFTGRAFDVQPYCAPLHEFRPAALALPGLNLFLDHEGGLERWHLQFLDQPRTRTV